MKTATLDINGLTPAEIDAKTAATLDQIIEAELERNEVFIADRGATQDEVASYLEYRKQVLADWKAECIAEIKRGLSDWSAPSAKLQ